MFSHEIFASGIQPLTIFGISLMAKENHEIKSKIQVSNQVYNSPSNQCQNEKGRINANHFPMIISFSTSDPGVSTGSGTRISQMLNATREVK